MIRLGSAFRLTCPEPLYRRCSVWPLMSVRLRRLSWWDLEIEKEILAPSCGHYLHQVRSASA
jgi:hypothetical protein